MHLNYIKYTPWLYTYSNYIKVYALAIYIHSNYIKYTPWLYTKTT